ncbi:alpha/beta hydrolase [Frigidibacter sp. ROC022]|uniref:alpha/beta hydrolase n=1 Tax=Frigidibacter sp. ROC022 TaxID=2971796 RepID=UPI00215AC12B|nr:alpha/beta hydrolase [Frigidibacter sp. ROC022]
MPQNDEAYANSDFIPGGAAYPDHWARAAAAFRSEALSRDRARLGLRYGPKPRNAFDLFLPEADPTGLVVLIHGGYWVGFGCEDFSHLARGCTGAGRAVALPSYTLAPEATIPQITAEIARAVTAAAGLVAGPVSVTGHSAGGHLAARMLCTDVPLPVRDRLSACVPVSPLSDLRPLIETSMNVDLRLVAETAGAESPALAAEVAPVPTTVRVGSAERPAFLEQARALVAAWPQARLQVAEARHHFDVIEAYEESGSSLVAALTGG